MSADKHEPDRKTDVAGHNPVQASEELSPLMRRVHELLGERVLEHHCSRGDDRIHIAREHILEVGQILRDDPELAFDLLLDVMDRFLNLRDANAECTIALLPSKVSKVWKALMNPSR